MSLKLCPNCMIKLHKLSRRCECGYDFKQRKVIPFNSPEEGRAFLLDEEKAAALKAKNIAIKTMFGGVGLIIFGILSFFVAGALAANKFSLGAIGLGIILFAKGVNNYFTGEVEDD